ncbi:MAG: FHA domain-containing protein [Candidatus Planktophila sp.]
MKSANDRELTTTLRLGNQPDAFPTESALFESYFSASTGEERAIIEEICNGSSDTSMLVIYKGPSKGSRFLITREGATIGRSQESEIFLDDVTVSRSHSVIAYLATSKSFEIADSSSLNGTYVNGTSIDRSVLKNGDEVQIGKFHLLFITGQK